MIRLTQHSSIENHKKLVKQVNKEKEDILFLRKKPFNNNKPIQWPFKV